MSDAWKAIILTPVAIMFPDYREFVQDEFKRCHERILEITNERVNIMHMVKYDPTLAHCKLVGLASEYDDMLRRCGEFALVAAFIKLKLKKAFAWISK